VIVCSALRRENHVFFFTNIIWYYYKRATPWKLPPAFSLHPSLQPKSVIMSSVFEHEAQKVTTLPHQTHENEKCRRYHTLGTKPNASTDYIRVWRVWDRDPPKSSSFARYSRLTPINPLPLSFETRTGQDRTGQVRSRTGQVRSGQVRSGQVRSGQVRSGRVSGFDLPPGSWF